VTVARALGLSLIAAAVLAGTALDRVPAGGPPRVNGQFVIAADFHVHAFIGDGGMPPWELAREARRRGLDALVISNHNQRLAARLAAFGASLYPADERAIVIRGQELTTPGYHMIAAGIERTIDWRLSAPEAIAAIHQQGGIAIAAHPGRSSWPAYDEAAIRLLDGTEAAHPSGNRFPAAKREVSQFFQRASAIKPALAPIGSSDFHFGGTLGECRTYVFADEFSASGVLDAVRKGATVASDGYGGLIGDPARVEAVRSLLAAAPPRIRAPWPSRIAAYVSVLGVLILLLWK
jgi:hypothetical protein